MISKYHWLQGEPSATQKKRELLRRKSASNGANSVMLRETWMQGNTIFDWLLS